MRTKDTSKRFSAMFRRTDLSTIILAILAVGQIIFLVTRAPAETDGISLEPPFQPVSIGDRVEALRTGPTGGGEFPLVGEGWTLVMSFNSACIHCETVAPVWRDWLAAHSDVRVVAVTTDSPTVAEDYRARHGWAGRGADCLIL